MEKITILATGDFAFTNRIGDLAIDNNLDKIFNDFIPKIKGVDLAITNLEVPLTKAIEPIKKTGPALKADPRCINVIKQVGFGLLTLANNHILDYGENGLLDTIELCKLNQINTLGAGKNNLEARKAFYFEKKGYKIAFLAIAENEWSTTNGEYCGAAPIELCDNQNDIAEAKNNANFVVVFVHGGHENFNLPTLRMKKQYRFFVDSGADVVIGHHPHCFSGFELYNNKPIFYSLGNFIFDLNKKTDLQWNEGFAVKLIFENNLISYELIPYIQNDEIVGIRCMNENEKISFNEKISLLSNIIKSNELLEKKFSEFAKKKQKMYNAFIQPYSNRYLQFLHSKGFIPNFWKGRKRLLLNNLIRCESHREMLNYYLKNENSYPHRQK